MEKNKATGKRFFKRDKTILISCMAVCFLGCLLFVVYLSKELWVYRAENQRLEDEAMRFGQEVEELEQEVEELELELDQLRFEAEKLKLEAANFKLEAEAANTGIASETELMLETQSESGEESSSIDISSSCAGDILDESLLDLDDIDSYFTAQDIEEGDEVYNRIIGKSYVENKYVPLESLVYLKLPHYNFDGQIQVGELIVNRSIADDVLSVFKEFFRIKYQVYSMRLIDDYWMDDGEESDINSIDHNNTSAFCFRLATESGHLSNHAYGKAIDINPQQNPYVSYRGGEPSWLHENSNSYIDRDTGLPHVITHADPAYEIFLRYGFTWGGDWNYGVKDYQHFEHY